MERLRAMFDLAREIDQLQNPVVPTIIIPEHELDLVELELRPIVLIGSAVINGREVIACLHKYRDGLVSVVVTFDDGYFDLVSTTGLYSSIEEACVEIEEITLRFILWY